MLHVPKKPLTEAVGAVSRLHREPQSAIFLQADAAAGTLSVQGGGDGSWLEQTLQADVDTDFAASFPGQVLDQMLRALPSELVALSCDAHELTLESGSAVTRLLRLDGDAPEVSWPERSPLKADATDLAAALSAVSYAVAVAEYQAVYRGVALEVDALACNAVGTDGFRLAAYRFDLSGEPVNLGAVLPRKGAEALVRLLKTGEVAFGLGEREAVFCADGWRFKTGLMEGTYPDWRRVIPGQFALSCELDAASLIDALKRVSILSDAGTNKRLDLHFAAGGVTLTADGPYGNARGFVEGTCSGEKPELFIAFNADFLTQALAKIDGAALLQFSGETTPAILSQVGGTAYTAMCVPLRTQ